MIDIFMLGVAMIGTAFAVAYVVVLCISLIVLVESIIEKGFGMFLVALFFSLFIGGIGLFVVGLFFG